MLPSHLIPSHERTNCICFLLGFGGVIVAWAIAHDLNLIRIEPRHFTEFHRPLLPLSSHILLAIQYAVVATLGPALLFGGIAFCLCRLGRRQPIAFRTAWIGFLPILAVIEISSLVMGHLARKRFLDDGALLFPGAVYPELTPGILFTQSANITAYVIAFVSSFLFFVILGVRRYFAPERDR